jgi:hypothetical protein
MTKGEQARWLSILVPMLCGGLLGFLLTALTPTWRSFTHGAGPHLTPAEHLEAIAERQMAAKSGDKAGPLARRIAAEPVPSPAPNLVLNLLGALMIAGLVIALVVVIAGVEE